MAYIHTTKKRKKFYKKFYNETHLWNRTKQNYVTYDME